MLELQINKSELLYQRKNFYENLLVYGNPCVIYSIADSHEEAYDFYSDIIDRETSFDDHIRSYITYQEAPQIKTLKSLGWYVETEELPIIAHLPVYYRDHRDQVCEFSPSLDDRITLKANPHDKNPSERSFLIKDFKGQGFPSTIYYIVKLVPYREG